MKINYLAVLVSAVLYWLLGWLWFGVLFAQRWMALEGITMAQAQKLNVPVHFGISFLLGLLMAFILANVCAWRNANTAGRGAAVGVLLWIGFVAPVAYTNSIYEGRPSALFAINYFYPLVGLWLMGIVIGLWKKKSA